MVQKLMQTTQNNPSGKLPIQILDDLQELKKSLESIVLHMESSMPKELPIPKVSILSFPFFSLLDFLISYVQGVLIINPSRQTIVECNDSFSNMLGRNKEELVGEPVSKICVPFFYRVIKR